jgi:hypothetical protein
LSRKKVQDYTPVQGILARFMHLSSTILKRRKFGPKLPYMAMIFGRDIVKQTKFYL